MWKANLKMKVSNKKDDTIKREATAKCKSRGNSRCKWRKLELSESIGKTQIKKTTSIYPKHRAQSTKIKKLKPVEAGDYDSWS